MHMKRCKWMCLEEYEEYSYTRVMISELATLISEIHSNQRWDMTKSLAIIVVDWSVLVEIKRTLLNQLVHQTVTINIDQLLAAVVQTFIELRLQSVSLQPTLLLHFSLQQDLHSSLNVWILSLPKLNDGYLLQQTKHPPT